MRGLALTNRLVFQFKDGMKPSTTCGLLQERRAGER
jgi:hypothetical protein